MGVRFWTGLTEYRTIWRGNRSIKHMKNNAVPREDTGDPGASVLELG
jgi:hypothetical protein